MSNPYIFKSQRLGFRGWVESDLAKMTEINLDQKVMEFFPRTQTEKETHDFIKKMNLQFNKNGYCYFAVELLIDHSFIGFIGLSEQTYEADFTPCIDIGWRLDKNHWGNGYATEGAKRCLKYGFRDLKLNMIYSIAPKINLKSELVMEKIGMKKVKEFDHSLLLENDQLKRCVLYEIKKND